MRRIMATAAVGCLALIGARLASGQDAGAPANDNDFVAKAAVGGSTEVALGKMAVQRATDAQVKQYGQMMLTDHTAANQELLALAGRKQIAVPREVDAKHKQAIDDLSRRQGPDFDRRT